MLSLLLGLSIALGSAADCVECCRDLGMAGCPTRIRMFTLCSHNVVSMRNNFNTCTSDTCNDTACTTFESDMSSMDANGKTNCVQREALIRNARCAELKYTDAILQC